MTREKIKVDQAYQLDYATIRDIATRSGGWLRSSGGEDGEIAIVVVDDKEYTFSGRGLVDFLYAVKDANNDVMYAVIDLLDYIAKSEKQSPSVFVRDAIVSRAAELNRKIKGEV